MSIYMLIYICYVTMLLKNTSANALCFIFKIKKIYLLKLIKCLSFQANKLHNYFSYKLREMTFATDTTS